MCDDRESCVSAPETAQSARALRRVADALGVPMSSFGGVDADETPKDDLTGPEEAVMGMVRSYLERASPTMRERFVTAVRTIVETLPR